MSFTSDITKHMGTRRHCDTFARVFRGWDVEDRLYIDSMSTMVCPTKDLEIDHDRGELLRL